MKETVEALKGSVICTVSRLCSLFYFLLGDLSPKRYLSATNLYDFKSISKLNRQLL